MESSGVADAGWVANIGYLVIRGTCDYCNTCKNDAWHNYAAAIAAAFARTLIEKLHPLGPESASVESTPDAGLPATSIGESGIYNRNNDSSDDSVKQTHVEQFTNVETSAVASEMMGATPSRKGHQLRLTTTRDPDSSRVIERPTAYNDDAITLKVGQLEQLLREGRLADANTAGAKLEQMLRSMPKKVKVVRAGWIVLCNLELANVQQRTAKGDRPNLERLHELKKEANDVAD